MIFAEADNFIAIKGEIEFMNWNIFGLTIGDITGILTLAVMVFLGILGFIKPRIKPTPPGIIITGTWYEYHWSNPEDKDIFKYLGSELVITRRKWGLGKSSFFLEYTLGDKFLHKYSGKGWFIDKHSEQFIDKHSELATKEDILLEVIYEGEFTETLYFRFDVSPKDNSEILTGVWAAFNFNKDIACGASILSRRRIDKRKLDEIFNAHFTINKFHLHNKK